jgi:fido (protein-threonine AMPylation protein)
VNYVHPFREGNGRTQLQYLKQLAAQADHPIDLTALGPARWLDASIAAHGGDYGPISLEITRALVDGWTRIRRVAECSTGLSPDGLQAATNAAVHRANWNWCNMNRRLF